MTRRQAMLGSAALLLAGAGAAPPIADADNPGQWAFHCHNDYHMAAGMMTSLRYEA